jgi:hypothetical protein
MNNLLLISLAHGDHNRAPETFKPDRRGRLRLDSGSMHAPCAKMPGGHAESECRFSRVPCHKTQPQTPPRTEEAGI